MKAHIYTHIISTIYASGEIHPADATSFILGSIEPGTSQYSAIMDKLTHSGMESVDIASALPDLRIIFGIQGVLRKYETSESDAIFFIRMIYELIERPREEGMQLLNHVAAIIDNKTSASEESLQVKW